MSTSDGSRLADALVDLFAPLGAIRHRRFFGGRGIVCGEVQFAMIIDGVPYLRVDAELAAQMQEHGAQPFVYGTRRRNVEVYSYYSIPEVVLDDEDVVAAWARRSLAVARQRWKAPRAQQKARR